MVRQQYKRYDSDFIESVLQEIKDGKSLSKISKEKNIPLSSISNWSRKYNVKSNYSHTKYHASTDDILKYIGYIGGATEQEIEKKFGYHRNALHNRLLNFVRQGKLKSIIFPRCGKEAAKLLSRYQGCRIYYVTEDGLTTWLKQLIPEKISSSINKSITRSIKSMGVNLLSKKHIPVDIDTYNIIANESEKLGIMPGEYINNLVLKNTGWKK